MSTGQRGRTWVWRTGVYEGTSDGQVAEPDRAGPCGGPAPESPNRSGERRARPELAV